MKDNKKLKKGNTNSKMSMFLYLSCIFNTQYKSLILWYSGTEWCLLGPIGSYSKVPHYFP